jgi:hypothetical protein
VGRSSNAVRTSLCSPIPNSGAVVALGKNGLPASHCFTSSPSRAGLTFPSFSQGAAGTAREARPSGATESRVPREPIRQRLYNFDTLEARRLTTAFPEETSIVLAAGMVSVMAKSHQRVQVVSADGSDSSLSL